MPKEYELKGTQVAEDAWSWLPESDEVNPANPKPKPDLSIPTLSQIKAVCDPQIDLHPFPDTSAKLGEQLDELRELQRFRGDPAKLTSNVAGKQRLPISNFLLQRPQPLSAVYDKTRPAGKPIVLTGYELARWFEKDTPTLAHTHALNYLLAYDKLSLPPNKFPPYQARIWAALNVAIYTALIAAWHYKWKEPRTKLKPRPVEIEDNNLSVLYDLNVDDSPVLVPQPHPGTPRHPSYPSGHSAIAGAASELLTRYFPASQRDFDYLADNSGLARMWAGIHYRADHEFGVAMGRAIGALIYERVNPK